MGVFRRSSCPSPPPPTPTPEGTSSSSKPEIDHDCSFPESWDDIMDGWDAEAAALDLAYGNQDDDDDLLDNVHG